MAKHAGLALVLMLLLGACSGDGPALADESILSANIPGTSETSFDDNGDQVTKLFDVSGDWVEVSIAIAEIVRDHGWSIEGINCVGTGNDVLARKQVDGRWLQLDSGAGTRGAGLIVSVAPDQRAPRPFTVTGRCPRTLEAAAAP
jgi:hypothetical protein